MTTQGSLDLSAPRARRPRGPRVTEARLEEIRRASWAAAMQMEAMQHMAEAIALGVDYHEHRCGRSCCRPFPEWYDRGDAK